MIIAKNYVHQPDSHRAKNSLVWRRRVIVAVELGSCGGHSDERSSFWNALFFGLLLESDWFSVLNFSICEILIRLCLCVVWIGIAACGIIQAVCRNSNYQYWSNSANLHGMVRSTVGRELLNSCPCGPSVSSGESGARHRLLGFFHYYYRICLRHSSF